SPDHGGIGNDAQPWITIDLLIAEGEADVKILSSDSNWFGVTYREDKPFVVEKLSGMIANGVYPRDLWD
ncbi:MAG TPA: hypothetical protein PLU49_08295, partial [Saprospiraceae bacterium]|nr:hypothetical protein [Saprospiraceae bacterium]